MTTPTAFLFLLSLAVGVPRVLGHHGEIYQAVAHVFVGGLLGAWLTAQRRRDLALALGLSALEVACFLFYGKQSV